MIKIDNNRTIDVFGVRFAGINEIKRRAQKQQPKSGVYVGVDRQRYPCFDSYDFMHEKRYFSNFVFAQSEEELKEKLRTLEKIEAKANYRKYTEELAPMLYWEGDNCHPMEITECEDLLIREKKTPKPKIHQERPEKTRLELIMERLKAETKHENHNR